MYWRLLGSSMFDAPYSGVFKRGCTITMEEYMELAHSTK